MNDQHQQEITCAICGRQFDSWRGLAFHVKQTHKIDSEDYYCEYIGEPKHCPICGKKTKFLGLGSGYAETCGVQKCIDAFNGHNKIISHYKLGKNYSSTCEDAAKYTPKSSPDAVFTCLPYLAKEIYTDKGAENLSPEEFEKWWGGVRSNFPNSVQHVFIHIDEETKPHIISATEANDWKLIEDRCFSKENAFHFNRGKDGEIKKGNWESILIFEKAV